MAQKSLFVSLLVLAIAGCLQRSRVASATPHGGAAQLAALAAIPEADRPPEPAPALFIPGASSIPTSKASPAADIVKYEFAGTSSLVPDLNLPDVTLPPSGALPVSTFTPDLTVPVAALAFPPGDESLRTLYAKVAKKYASMDTYIMRLKRREVISGAARPEEVMLCKLRIEPFSVYFKWLGEEGKGREVVYVKGKYENQIHSLIAAGDVLFLPAGKRFKVAPDSFLVKSKSRYPITEAGLGPMVARFGKLVAAVEKGDSREGSAKYIGLVDRPEFEKKVECVVQSFGPKSDPLVPRGGQRLWFFDTELHLPVLLITNDEGGREVEYYCHDRFIIPARLTEDDFNPDVLWGKK